MDLTSGGSTDADGTESGWALVAAHDGAAAVIDVVLGMTPDETLTRSELCEASSVSYKTLYLADTIDALVDTGLLEKREHDAEETTFSVNAESPAYDAAAAFDDAV